MATNRKPKALIEAEKKIVELEGKLVALEAKNVGTEKQSQDWYKRYSEEKSITDGLHEVLDDLGIRGYRDDNKYNRVPLTVRLFAWALKIKSKEVTE